MNDWKEIWEEKYGDKGDERYGLVKHHNTIVQNQIDDIQSILTSQKEAFLKAIEGKRKIEKDEWYSESEAYNIGLDAALEAIKSV